MCRRSAHPALALLGLSLALSSCDNEDFDSRYDRTRAELKAEQRKIDAELDETLGKDGKKARPEWAGEGAGSDVNTGP